MSYAATVLADSPVGYWRLDESSGTVAADASGNALDGTYSGTPALGQTPLITNGTAVAFDGVDDVVTLPADALLNITGDIALELLVQTTTTGVELILGALPGGGDPGYALAIDIFGADGKISFWNGVGWIPSGSAFNDGTRHYLVVSLSGTTLTFYKDNAVDRVVTSVAAPNSYAGARAIGANVGGAFPFAGTLDEVAIYAGALSAGQVAAHWDAALGHDPLAGQSDMVVGMSGAARVAHALSGHADLAPTLSGSMAAHRPLAGQANALVGLSGAMRLTDAEAGRTNIALGLNGAMRVRHALVGAVGATVGLRACARIDQPAYIGTTYIPLTNDSGATMPSVYDLPFGIVEDAAGTASILQLTDCA